MHKKYIDWLNSVDNIGGIRVKKSRSIHDIEAIYWRLFTKLEEYRAKGSEISKQIAATNDKKAHFEFQNMGFGLYELEKENFCGREFDALNSKIVEEPANKINFQLGQDYYENDRLYHIVLMRLLVAKNILGYKIITYLYKQFPDVMPGSVVELIINQRKYVYCLEYSNGQLVWESLVFGDSQNCFQREL